MNDRECFTTTPEANAKSRVVFYLRFRIDKVVFILD